MGREIRRVPKGWEHPKNNSGKYQPIYDESYDHAISEWLNNHSLWLEGKHPDQLDDVELMTKYKYYAEWGGNAPDVEYYRPDWKPEEMTEYVLYETVSEGTPISPAFSTKEALAEYLAEHGDYWEHNWTLEQAKAMVEREYTPSFIMSGGKLHSAEESTLL